MGATFDRALTGDTLHVYPTALKAESVLREGARSGGGLLGHRVTTFPQLTDALARDLGVPPRVIGPELAAVVLAAVVERGPRWAAWRASQRGFVRELLGVIAELKAAYLGPGDVAGIGAALGPGPAGERLAEIGGAYAAYEAALERMGALDRHGREWRVWEALAGAEAAGKRPRVLAGVRRIVFAEIYDFSVVQFLIATSLIRLVGDAELIAFAHPENVDATRFLDRTWNRFVGDPSIADQVLPSFVMRGGRQGTLAAVLRGVFTPEPPPPAGNDGAVRLVLAPDRYREVEHALREVRRRLEGGEPAERIALVTRDLALYGDLIEDVGRRYRVPLHFRTGKPLLASGLVKACLNLARCVAEGLPRGRLEALLDSDYLRAGHPGLVRALRRSGFVSETARPLAECLTHRGGPAPGAERLGAVAEALRPLDEPRTVRGHVAALRRTLRRLGFRPVGAPDVPPEVARRDAHAWERLDQTLVSLGAIAGAAGVGRIPLGEFVRLLFTSLELLRLEDRAEPVGSVRALDVLDARGLDFDTVYLLGLDDGTFPAPRAESPLLPDAVKREVNPLAAAALRRKLGAHAAGLPAGTVLRTAREASLEEPFLFFLALSMAERELVISWPAVDERGNPTVRSPFVDEVAACLAEAPVPEVLSPTALVPPTASCAEPAELVARAAADRWRRRPPGGLVTALREALPAGAARFASIDRRALVEERRSRYFLAPPGAGARKEALADGHVGRLGGDLEPLRARLRAMRWSPTRLERLGACGFRFFAADVLRLGEEREPDLEVAAAEQGTLFHEALRAFFTAHPLLPPDRDAARTLARNFLDGVRDRVAGAIAAKDPHFLAVSWTRLEAALDELIDEEHARQAVDLSGGVTVARRLEESLEFDLPDPAGGAPLRLRGRPDRVEVHCRGARATRVRVLDYKAARDPRAYRALLDPEREMGSTSFQIPVYLLGALAAGVPGLRDDTVLEGGYVVLLAGRGRKFQTAPIEGDLLAPGAATPGGEATLAERIRRLVAAASAGRFDVDPHPCDPWCPYRSVCRYQPPPLEDEEGQGD